MVFAITVADPAAGAAGAAWVTAGAACVGTAVTTAALLHALISAATASRAAANLIDVPVGIGLLI
jgi:hypothetical protein